MTDDLRTRIIAALLSEDDVALMADAVIEELDRDYILVPKWHTIARIRSAEKLGLTGDGE